MEIYDCHLHTTYSKDGKSTLDEMCGRALVLGMRAITVTDHNEPDTPGFPAYEHIRQSVAAAKRMNEELGGRLQVYAGVELADQFIGGQDPAPYYEMDLDCILGSIHSTKMYSAFFPDHTFGSDLLQSAQKADMDFLKKFVEAYYSELRKTAEKADVDVIAHLTFPLRYINGRANRGLDIAEFYPLIDQVLAAVVKTGKALEVNTSGMATDWKHFMPDEDILKRYYALGGRFVTTGSDAHRAENLGVGIPEAIHMLQKIGFTHGSYFVKRKRFEYQF